MSLKRRLNKLEGKIKDEHHVPFIPWTDDASGTEVDGEFLTWEEYAERFPGAPLPLRWAELEN